MIIAFSAVAAPQLSKRVSAFDVNNAKHPKQVLKAPAASQADPIAIVCGNLEVDASYLDLYLAYGSPFEMLQRFGVNYTAAGENIAAGQKSAEAVMTDWLNSSGHRANILNKEYKELGVGYVTGGSYGTYWVQLFTK